jgi:hypothetical protein
MPLTPSAGYNFRRIPRLAEDSFVLPLNPVGLRVALAARRAPTSGFITGDLASSCEHGKPARKTVGIAAHRFVVCCLTAGC